MDNAVANEVALDKASFDMSVLSMKRCQKTNCLSLDEVHLERAAPSAFAKLREQHFSIPASTYAQAVSLPLKPLSNLGLSGSAFFHTNNADTSSNAGLFIKSINRAFEFEFMHEKLLPAYIAYMEEHSGADSLLTRITDVIWSADTSVGALLSVSPRHYIVMVDVLGDLKAIEGAHKWDLKPSGFFEVRQSHSSLNCGTSSLISIAYSGSRTRRCKV